ncbi:TPA: hypothetical protein ACH3X1_016078 [Trebouxia sp. C0004]
MLKFPIRAAFDAQGYATNDEADEAAEHWLCSAYKDLQQHYSLPDWPKAYNEKLEEWGAFSKGALKVWLHCKLEAECHSRRVGQHSNERDRQFTEIDRLIKSLLETKLYSQADNADAMDSPGPLDARPTMHNIRCPVKGPMIVIRSRPDGMGEKTLEVSSFIKVDSMDKLTGAYSRYGIIGVSLNINGAFKVGFQGQGNPGPWTVGPSVYSIMLINVASTVKEGALYPAKPYHEDVDFAHLCDERQLVVGKQPVTRKFFDSARSCGSSDTLRADHQDQSKAPSILGAPVHMAIGQNRADLLPAGV